MFKYQNCMMYSLVSSVEDAEIKVRSGTELLSCKTDTTMNPLAEPFIFSSDAPSCEQLIMTDQLLKNNAFGRDEAIEEQFCSTFAPCASCDVILWKKSLDVSCFLWNLCKFLEIS